MEINYKGSHRDIKVLPKLMPDDTKQVHMRFTDTQTPRHDPDLNTLHKTPHGSVKNTQTHSLMHSPAYTQLALVLCFVLHMVCLWEVICCFSTYTHTHTTLAEKVYTLLDKSLSSMSAVFARLLSWDRHNLSFFRLFLHPVLNRAPLFFLFFLLGHF